MWRGTSTYAFVLSILRKETIKELLIFDADIVCLRSKENKENYRNIGYNEVIRGRKVEQKEE
jgi:hypothetical protein